MGSLVKCYGCGERCGARPIGVYWRWLRADNRWAKYYGRYCIGCYAAKVVPMDVEYPADQRLTCPACGIDTDTDYDAIYTTSFPAKRSQVDTEAPFCDVHAAEFRVWITEHAQPVEDVDGAPEPHPRATAAGLPPDQVMAALGRDPRVGR